MLKRCEKSDLYAISAKGNLVKRQIEHIYFSDYYKNKSIERRRCLLPQLRKKNVHLS